MTSRQQRRALERHMDAVVVAMRAVAARGAFEGRLDTPRERAYLRACTRDDLETGARLIFSRDAGHHASGWFKNPDYERCWHLSMSPLAGRIVTAEPRELARDVVLAWVRAFFADATRHVWAESPKSAAGLAAGVWHWRVFCDAAWMPLAPRGEVYSSEFTEKGWRSASEVLALGGPEVVGGLDGTVDPT
jgi:hypothetical protein